MVIPQKLRFLVMSLLNYGYNMSISIISTSHFTCNVFVPS